MEKNKITVSNVKITNEIFKKGKKFVLTTLVSAGLITGLTGCGPTKQERIDKEAETLQTIEVDGNTLEIKEDIFAKEAEKEALKDPNKDDNTIYVEAPPIISGNEAVQDFTPDADGWVTITENINYNLLPEDIQKVLLDKWLVIYTPNSIPAFLKGDKINVNTGEFFNPNVTLENLNMRKAMLMDENNEYYIELNCETYQTAEIPIDYQNKIWTEYSDSGKFEDKVFSDEELLEQSKVYYDACPAYNDHFARLLTKGDF